LRLLSHPGFWLSASLVYIGLTFLLSLIPGSGLLPKVPFRLDWILHAIEYGLLSWLLSRYLAIRNDRLGRWGVAWRVLTVCGIIGGLNELIQSSVPGRFSSLSDCAANLVGAALAFLLFYQKISKPTS
jgi:VanZ family protein